jgi:hypothetical protein
MNFTCPICLDKIQIFYYKSKNCNCNIRYHNECVIKWHKISKTCIYCGKKINIDLNKIRNKYYEYIVIILNLIIILFYYLFYYLFSM